MEVFHRRVEEAPRDLDVAEAAHAQQPRDGGMQVQRRAEGLRLLVIAREMVPEECGFHVAVGMSEAVSVNEDPSSPMRRNFA